MKCPNEQSDLIVLISEHEGWNSAMAEAEKTKTKRPLVDFNWVYIVYSPYYVTFLLIPEEKMFRCENALSVHKGVLQGCSPIFTLINATIEGQKRDCYLFWFTFILCLFHEVIDSCGCNSFKIHQQLIFPSSAYRGWTNIPPPPTPAWGIY